jgi:2-polyprenyl-3-methyl-5-hydroxy-6-metoxy-1,4-benzoquinol methylase
MDTTNQPTANPTAVSEADLRIYRAQGSRLASIGADAILADHQRKAKWYAARLARFLPANKDAEIVDIPCGEGNILFYLREAGYLRVTGYEIDADRVDLAKAMQLHAVQGNALEIVQALRNVDVFFCVDFIEHISKDAAIEFLLHVCRSLSSQGRLILRTPVTDSPRETIHLHNDFTHKWGVNSVVWQTLATATGFEVVAIIDERPVMDTPLHACMRAAFEAGKFIYTAQCCMMNLPVPQAWTPSAWFIMDKTT